jgi:hypothetical protein
MSLRAHTKNPITMMRVGLSFLIAASLARWLLDRGAGPSPNAADFGMGALYGLAFGCLLASIILSRRRRPEP